jgi:secreted protein with Ig-like and vWFA domain
MKTIHDILNLGDPRLYESCEQVSREELPQVMEWVQQLHEAMEDIRKVPAKNSSNESAHLKENTAQIVKELSRICTIYNRF